MSNRKRKERILKQSIILVSLIFVIYLLYKEVGLRFFSSSTISIYFENPNKSFSRKFSLEVADTPETTAKGLMFRKKLDPEAGMIFVSAAEKKQTFWMKNTYISLDMIFLDSGLKVVGILPNVPILNEERRESDKPAKYVIELNAGTGKKFGIEVGSIAKVSSGKL